MDNTAYLDEMLEEEDARYEEEDDIYGTSRHRDRKYAKYGRAATQRQQAHRY